MLLQHGFIKRVDTSGVRYKFQLTVTGQNFLKTIEKALSAPQGA
jgi:predicted transcriptional regulator